MEETPEKDGLDAPWVVENVEQDMVPTCSCPCGASLELRHARSRDIVERHENWDRWRLRFRCPRCGQTVYREFDARREEAETQALEVYDR